MGDFKPIEVRRTPNADTRTSNDMITADLLKSDRPAEVKNENPFNVNDLSASCPVKAALKEGDPMAYLTSPSFLGKFFIASSLILLSMSSC